VSEAGLNVMLIAIGSGLGVLLCAIVYILFGARMAAKQRTWTPASVSLIEETGGADSD
jgi:putative Ca2+/H+ antiporter (TMEM165/GDT1 family)